MARESHEDVRHDVVVTVVDRHGVTHEFPVAVVSRWLRDDMIFSKARRFVDLWHLRHRVDGGRITDVRRA